jgi:hypothetical protein
MEQLQSDLDVLEQDNAKLKAASVGHERQSMFNICRKLRPFPVATYTHSILVYPIVTIATVLQQISQATFVIAAWPWGRFVKLLDQIYPDY